MDKHKIITISRQSGSGGREIGQKLAKQLHIPFYDKKLIGLAAKKIGISKDFFENAENNGAGSVLYTIAPGAFFDLPLSDKVYLAQCTAIREFAQQGSCVIFGCCANEILKNSPNVLNVFIYADIKSRKKRTIEEYHTPAEKIEEHILAIDKKRAAYFNYYSNMKFGRTESYHLCIDSGYVGINGAIELIKTAYFANADV
nr:cytidylate kinase-like family protein [uncultured Anaerocolumna sp.]